MLYSDYVYFTSATLGSIYMNHFKIHQRTNIMQQKHNKLYQSADVSVKKIGNNMASLMKRDNIDAQTLSDKTGVGVATIKNIRRGVGNPTISTLYSIANYFNISVGALTEGHAAPARGEIKIATMPLIKYKDIELFLSSKSICVENYTTEVDDYSDDSLFAFEMTNNAFSPELERASICVVSGNEKPHDGDIVLLRIQGYPIALRRAYIGESGMIFCNISFENEIAPVSYSEYEIVGVLLKVTKRLK